MLQLWEYWIAEESHRLDCWRLVIHGGDLKPLNVGEILRRLPLFRIPSLELYCYVSLCLSAVPPQ
jgi:hypothetical protein